MHPRCSFSARAQGYVTANKPHIEPTSVISAAPNTRYAVIRFRLFSDHTAIFGVHRYKAIVAIRNNSDVVMVSMDVLGQHVFKVCLFHSVSP